MSELPPQAAQLRKFADWLQRWAVFFKEQASLAEASQPFGEDAIFPDAMPGTGSPAAPAPAASAGPDAAPGGPPADWQAMARSPGPPAHWLALFDENSADLFAEQREPGNESPDLQANAEAGLTPSADWFAVLQQGVADFLAEAEAPAQEKPHTDSDSQRQQPAPAGRVSAPQESTPLDPRREVPPVPEDQLSGESAAQPARDSELLPPGSAPAGTANLQRDSPPAERALHVPAVPDEQAFLQDRDNLGGVQQSTERDTSAEQRQVKLDGGSRRVPARVVRVVRKAGPQPKDGSLTGEADGQPTEAAGTLRQTAAKERSPSPGPAAPSVPGEPSSPQLARDAVAAGHGQRAAPSAPLPQAAEVTHQTRLRIAAPPGAPASGRPDSESGTPAIDQAPAPLAALHAVSAPEKARSQAGRFPAAILPVEPPRAAPQAETHPAAQASGSSEGSQPELVAHHAPAELPANFPEEMHTGPSQPDSAAPLPASPEPAANPQPEPASGPPEPIPELTDLSARQPEWLWPALPDNGNETAPNLTHLSSQPAGLRFDPVRRRRLDQEQRGRPWNE